jgi:hypothetical protein
LRIALNEKPGNSGEPPPFAWAVHFPEVFQGTNRGFDLVIANPPYVRTSSLSATDRSQLKKCYCSMQSKNVDLYYAFVERCFRAPHSHKNEEVRKKNKEVSKRDLYGLAGRGGGVAFILPSFAQTTSAEHLRAILAGGGHVDRWVDFLDLQVFPTATNYVALLFATTANRNRKTFVAQIVTPTAFDRSLDNEQWLEGLPESQVHYRQGGWDIRLGTKAKAEAVRPLHELATVRVGIQTSLDSLYLFDIIRSGDDPALVVVKNKGDKKIKTEEVVLERAALFPCAKGSRDLQGDRFKDGCYVLWPYDTDGLLVTAELLEAKFPHAWRYLLANRSELKKREKGKFRGPDWWRFRRPQGVKCATQPEDPCTFDDERTNSIL